MLNSVVNQFKYRKIIEYLEKNDFSKLEYFAGKLLDKDFNQHSHLTEP